MLDDMHRPELIIIAGPNGSGKTSVTQRFLHHEWAEFLFWELSDSNLKTAVCVIEHSGCRLKYYDTASHHFHQLMEVLFIHPVDKEPDS